MAESLGAVGTSEGFFLVVEALVRHEVRVADVPLATLGTAMWLRSPVDVQVASQVTALDEGLGTDFTAEPLVLLRKKRERTRVR